MVAAVVVTLVAAIYGLVNGRKYFSNRTLRQVGTEIKTFGIWSPLVIFSLMLLAALVPPLPIPMPFLEISAGIIFGFWPGAVLILISQIASAIACFSLSKRIGRMFVEKIVNLPVFAFFKQFIEKKGALAVFVFRATMSCPFNISYFSGLISMDSNNFFWASALGSIPETTLFVYIGTLISQRVRFRLWYVFIILLILNYLPTGILLVMNYLKKNKRR